jgi:hypothetical protein
MSRLVTHYLCRSSEILNLGLKGEVTEAEGDVGNGEEDGLNSEQENLLI